MTAPARVLWLAKGLGRGGTEGLLTNSAAHIDPARFEVEVAYLLPWNNAMAADLRAQGVPVHCLRQRFEADLSWILRLRKLVRERRYNIVHTHMPLPAAEARVALRRRGTALVHTEHNTWQSYRRSTRILNARTLGHNDAVIAVSNAVAASIKGGHNRPPVHVVYHGIDYSAARRGAAARKHARTTLAIDENDFVIGTVGNFRLEKDQRTLVKAMGILRLSHPDVTLVMVGFGPLEGELRRQVDALGLADAIRFVGSRNDVLELMPAFDIFVLSSLYEGLGIALVEAMASGLPCVATAVGGVPEVFDDGVEGLLVSPQDPPALAAALGKLYDDSDLRSEMGIAAVERARQFDIRRAVRRTEQIYDQVLAAR